MTTLSKTEIIEQQIMLLLNNGSTDREFIIAKVSSTVGMPKSFVSRVANQLAEKMKKRLGILNQGYEHE